MKPDQSYGVVPVRKVESHWEVLVIRQKAGHWGFPKGHKEGGESPLEAAARELQEETSLEVTQWLNSQPFEEHYIFEEKGVKIDKTVYYYPALVKNEINLQQVFEVIDAQWVTFDIALTILSFQGAKKVLKLTNEVLSNHIDIV